MKELEIDEATLKQGKTKRNLVHILNIYIFRHFFFFRQFLTK
jgi:hypothetical protein